MAFFTVVVPVYNVEMYLKECLESILQQDFDDYEIVAVDDGSTDNSGKILDEYSAINKKIKVIHKENGGVVSARKAAARAASGKYVITVDSDDSLVKGAMSCMFEILNNGDYDMLFYDYYKLMGNDKRMLVENNLHEGLYTGEELEELKRNFLGENKMPHSLWTRAIKKELYVNAQLGLPETFSLGDDAAVMLICMINARSIYVLHKALYEYKILSSTSITKGLSNKGISELINMTEYLADISKAFKEEYKKQMYQYVLIRMICTMSRWAVIFPDADTYCGALDETSENVLGFVKKSKPLTVKQRVFKAIITTRNWKLLWLFYSIKRKVAQKA